MSEAGTSDRPSTPLNLSLWEESFLFTETGGVPTCLVCGKVLTNRRNFNLQRHYSSHHSNDYAKYKGEERITLIQQLKDALVPQHEDHHISESAVRLSYKISLQIARKWKPFVDGMFIKDCLVIAAEELCPELVPSFESVSLSPSTVMRRIQEMSEDVKDQLIGTAKSFVVYSVAIDESTDIDSTAQLAIFVRGVDMELKITEELLDLVAMKGTATGLDIFRCVDEAVQSMGLSWNKLVSVATDGAPAMIGHQTGFVGCVNNKMKELDIVHEVVPIHCIIHQQNLCAKSVSLQNVMEVVVKTTNTIRSKGLQHRQFKQFLEELDTEHGDIPYHCAVRWLSRAKVLDRFFELRDEIGLFLEMHDKPVPELKNEEWVSALAFLADLCEHLNVLNMSLQGKNEIITDLFGRVNAFKIKLSLWESQLRDKNTCHFPRLTLVYETVPLQKFEVFAQVLKELSVEFQCRFQEMEKIRQLLHIFATPMSADYNNVSSEYQLEIIDLQNDLELQDKFKNKVNLRDFYKHFPQQRFPRLHRLAARMLCMFGTTYLCEQTFSLMKITKSRYRSQLSDCNLHSILRLSVTRKMTPDVEMLVKRR